MSRSSPFANQKIQDSKTPFGIYFDSIFFFFLLFYTFSSHILVFTQRFLLPIRILVFTNHTRQYCGITSNGVSSNATGNHESKTMPKVVQIRSQFFSHSTFSSNFFLFFLVLFYRIFQYVPNSFLFTFLFVYTFFHTLFRGCYWCCITFYFSTFFFIFYLRIHVCPFYQQVFTGENLLIFFNFLFLLTNMVIYAERDTYQFVTSQMFRTLRRRFRLLLDGR